jgi:hypothetical protein
MEDDFNLDIEVGSLAMSMEMEVCWVTDFFIFFLTKYDERVIHNMLSLMLNPIQQKFEINLFF